MEETKKRRRRLNRQQKEEIIAGKGKEKAAALAEKFNVTTKTVYNVWGKAKKAGVVKKRGVRGPGRKPANPNQQRIDFCKRWIALLQDEVKRLENEPDLIKEAEAALAKVIGSKK